MKNGTLSVQGSLIAVVDNDLAVRNSLKFALELEGFSVRAYADGIELLQDASLPDCACLVIDQSMLGMTGLNLLGRLRDRRVSAPAILVTSDPSANLRERAAIMG